MMDESTSLREMTAPSGEGEEAIAILIVDDDPKNLLALESTLENSTVRLVKALTAEQALLALMHEDFAAIVLDVQMPDLDGIQLARLIKQRRKTQHIPILFLTAHYRETEHAVLGYDVGAVDYLTKPVHPGVLRSKVSVFVDLFRKTRALALINRAMEDEIAERKIVEERFRVVVEAAPSAILVMDADQTIILVNPQAEILFGRSKSQLLRMRLSSLIPVDRLPRDEVSTAARETVIRRPEGEEVPVEVRLTAINTTDAGRWLASIVDITERKRADAALRAQADAEAANAAKDRFLAMLSHELRTPLSPVLHTVSLLNEDPACPDSIRKDLEIINRNVQLEARLIDDLLDVARIRNGKLELQKQWVNAHDLLQNILQMCETESRARGLELICEMAEGNPHLLADPARLQQIFWNLLNNALKFTPAGGRIQVMTRTTEKGWLEVEVTDTGAGIPPEKLPLIFDAFEQVQRASSGGLGLGLAICKALAELHGGKVEARSAGSRRGATFVVRLPLPDASARPEKPNPDGATPTETPMRVLLVEDHKDTAETLQRLLVRRKYEVRSADSYTAALETARDFRFDVLVTDIGLPDGNGVDLFLKIRSDDTRRPLHGIALSGFGMDEDIARSLAAGFEHHITKPVEFARLHRCLQEIGAKLVAESGKAP